MALAGGFSYLGQQATKDGNVDKAAGYGNTAVSMVFIFTFVFGATWLTVPWLYPAEIFPLEVRAKGNAWGVVGWSIGNGWLTLLCPIMFQQLGEKTPYIFAACNAITIPMVWALYPETNQRTLEEINLLFASDSIWNWAAEENFAKLQEQIGHGTTSDSKGDVERGPSRKNSLVHGMSLHVEPVHQDK